MKRVPIRIQNRSRDSATGAAIDRLSTPKFYRKMPHRVDALGGNLDVDTRAPSKHFGVLKVGVRPETWFESQSRRPSGKRSDIGKYLKRKPYRPMVRFGRY